MLKLKNKIFGIFVIVLIVFAFGMFIFMYFNLSNTIETLANNQINEITDKVETKLDIYFHEVRIQLIQIKELTNNGTLDAEFNPKFNYYLFPIFNTSPQITTFALARTNGDEFSLLREDSTWLNNFVYETDSGMNIRRERWKKHYSNRQIIRKWEDYNAGYDPRTRKWFKGAMNAKDTCNPFWSEPYKILFQTFPGITASMKARSKLKNEWNVVQYDILLTEISNFTKSLAFNKNGKVFLLSEDFKILGLPKHKNYTHADSLKKYLLQNYDSLSFSPLKNSVKTWKKEINKFAVPYSFYENNEKWWADLHKYQLDNGRYFIIGVIVPESDFLSEIQKTRTIITWSLIFIMIFLIIIANGYFEKRKANQKLRLQKAEIEQQKEEIMAQHNQLTEQNKQIRDSINYAYKIQSAVFPSSEMIGKILKNYFILLKPRDVVSGDFYWIKKIDKYFMVAAADCTGHGVPGAFMSMLGISFLNEIVRQQSISKANQVLNELREQVKTTLRQTGKEHEAQDGMDMAFCVFDSEKNTLQYSGAYNPLYIIRNRKLLVYKATRNPIGIYRKEKPFQNHEIQLQKGDKIYLFSDGYVDQLGGEADTKFLTKRFKKLLLKISVLPFREQRTILDETFEKWKNQKAQNDDILIIGLEITN